MTAGLRFCMLSTFYPPYSFGGDGIAIQRLSRALVRAGHEVTVVHDVDAYEALDSSGAAPRGLDDDGVKVVSLRARVGRLSPLLTHQTGRPVVHGRRIRRLLAAGKFDVVNFHNVSLLGGPGILRYGEDAIRLYTAHEHWLICPTHVLWRNGREPCMRPACTRCVLTHRRPPQLWRYTGSLVRHLRHVDAIIALSEFSREKHREFGFPYMMEVLPPFLPDEPLDMNAPTRVHPNPYFLYVGRLERMKGLSDLLAVMSGRPGADLLIAGDGEDRGEAIAAAAQNPRVRLLGRLSEEALRDYYEQALALVVPSIGFETFGMVLIEAFRHGTPVIARRLGPFPEIVERSGAGRLFSSNDELAMALRELESQPSIRAELGRAAREAFRAHWTESVVLPEYLGIIRKAAARRRHHHVADKLTPVRNRVTLLDRAIAH